MLYIADHTLIDFYDFSQAQNHNSIFSRLLMKIRLLSTLSYARKNNCSRIIIWNPIPEVLIFGHNIKIWGYLDLSMKTDTCLIQIDLRK